jgi:hypothetical protein
MRLVLALPGLLAPRETAAAAPALAQLLAEGGAGTRAGDDIAEALAPRYGVVPQADLPMAPIRLAALGVDPGDAFWLAADPVTLDVGRDEVRLAGIVDDLDRTRSDALIALLNAHFAGDGIVFVAPRPDAIFVRAAVPPSIRTRPPAAAIGRSLAALLPEGPDAGTWRRWQSEIQMLLHEHPLNAERERAGKPPVNSVWFSGGGTLPARGASGRAIRTFAGAGTVAALAAHAGSPARPLPERLAAALSAAAAGAELLVVVLDGTADIASLESLWAAPARAALAAGHIESVCLVADGAGDAVVWQVPRRRLWRRLAARFATRDLAALLAAARRDV